ncbi:hypothetical protein JB92DRAFT_2895006 [Gautieria morchelliformis]|nr:hypothetical protein JB92DRAFT_2895006 [Gautieria morchelliformis]
MSSLAPGRLNVFGLDNNRGLVWKYKGNQTETIWSDYHGNGGKWLYEPVSLSRVLNEISVFMVGEDCSLNQSNFDLVNVADLGPWKNLGGKLTSPPAVAKREDGIIHIFHIGSDHAIYHKVWDGVVYSPVDGFEKLEGQFTHTPTAVSTGAEDVSVFAIGQDNRLHHYRWQSSSGWSTVEKLPGNWAHSPKAVSDRVGSVDVFGIDPRGNVTHVFCSALHEMSFSVRCADQIGIGNGKDWNLETLSGTFLWLDAIYIFGPGMR